MSTHRPFSPRRQGGAALIVGLLLLMVLTIISLSGLKNTRRQQQMTSNAEFELRTFSAAEAAIRDVFNEARYLRDPPDGEVYILREAILRAENGTD
ncbi:MAG: pilus assembly PilX family protein, partial [Oceanococcaceae bacterium]